MEQNRRLHCFPLGWHPYQVLFARALALHGVALQEGVDFTDQWLLENATKIDGVNFQWPEQLWSASTLGPAVRSIFAIHRYCRTARKLGKRLVWTVHNHRPHDRSTVADWAGSRVLAANADLVVVHSRWSQRYVRQHFKPRRAVIVMPIGNFDGFYRPSSREEATRSVWRQAADCPTCGLIGGVRPYRGHELAIDASRRLSGKMRLLIAGHARDADYVARLRSRIGDCGTIRFEPTALSDTGYAAAVQACDVILLPYREITGSAALLAAWTLSRPVVTSDHPYFREICASDSPANVRMSEDSAESLGNAMMQLLSIPREQREAAARRQADRYDWKRMIWPVLTEMASWPGWEAVGRRKTAGEFPDPLAKDPDALSLRAGA